MGPPLCSVVVTALSGAGSAPQLLESRLHTHSELQREVRWHCSTPAGRGANEYSSAGAAHQEVHSVESRVTPACSQSCWQCPRPRLSHGNAGNWPGCPSGAVLTKPQEQICLSQAPGPTVVAHLDPPWELRNQPTPRPHLRGRC